MKLITTIQPSDFGDENQHEDARREYKTREAARGIIKNSDGQYALMHSIVWEYCKLPGGGIDDGEEKEAALRREIREEVGCEIKHIEPCGQIVEYRDKNRFKQTSYCYTAKVDGEIGDPILTQSEIDEGFELVWAKNLDVAIDLIESGANSKHPEAQFMVRRDSTFLRELL